MSASTSRGSAEPDLLRFTTAGSVDDGKSTLIGRLLSVPRVVVAVNKMDLVGYDAAVFERIRAEYSEFAAKLGFSDLTFIPVSALKGDNVVQPSPRMAWYDAGTLMSYLEHVYMSGDANLIDFRFPVQRVVGPAQRFSG